MAAGLNGGATTATAAALTGMKCGIGQPGACAPIRDSPCANHAWLPHFACLLAMSRLSLPDLLKQCTPEERVGLQKLYDDYNRCLLSEYKVRGARRAAARRARADGVASQFTLAGLGAGGLLAARTRRKQLFVLSSALWRAVPCRCAHARPADAAQQASRGWWPTTCTPAHTSARSWGNSWRSGRKRRGSTWQRGRRSKAAVRRQHDACATVQYASMDRTS